jgi:hypothetical protein
MSYFVLIGDIIQSKAIVDRYSVQKDFSKALTAVGQKYKPAFVSPLTITIGDEFQAVFSKADKLFDIISEIYISMSGINFRYGMGVGPIETVINSNQAIGMDGPAFHFAREALNSAKGNGTHFFLRCGDSEAEERINTLLKWVDITLSRWTNERKLILHYYRQNKTQQEIGSLLNMTQSAVSQNINDRTFKLLDSTQKIIINEINRVMVKS